MYKRETDLLSDKTNSSFDIVVVGGGAAGTAAAIASARGGVSTLLIERDSFLGGVGYSGLFQYICGLYLNGDVFQTETLNQGIVREIVALLKELSPEKQKKKMGLVYVLPYRREDLLSVFNSLCNNESKLTVSLNTTALSVKKKNGEITEVIINREGSECGVSTGIVIDCSGSGVISTMAGAYFELSPKEKIQLAGYTVQIKGMGSIEETLSIKVPYYLAQGVRKNILSPYLRLSTFAAGDTPDEGYVKMSMNGIDGDCMEPKLELEREKNARQDASMMHRYLSEMIPAFKGSYIAGASKRVMDREGRRVCGEYTLTGEDVINARKFDDGVVKNSWPIEIWDKQRGTVYKYVKQGDYYEIPLRCLKVKAISNLLSAGRCISVSSEALGSTRVMGACMSLGEQAGLAAAYEIKKGVYP